MYGYVARVCIAKQNFCPILDPIPLPPSCPPSDGSQTSKMHHWPWAGPSSRGFHAQKCRCNPNFRVTIVSPWHNDGATETSKYGLTAWEQSFFGEYLWVVHFVLTVSRPNRMCPSASVSASLAVEGLVRLTFSTSPTRPLKPSLSWGFRAEPALHITRAQRRQFAAFGRLPDAAEFYSSITVTNLISGPPRWRYRKIPIKGLGVR